VHTVRVASFAECTATAHYPFVVSDASSTALLLAGAFVGLAAFCRRPASAPRWGMFHAAMNPRMKTCLGCALLGGTMIFSPGARATFFDYTTGGTVTSIDALGMPDYGIQVGDNFTGFISFELTDDGTVIPFSPRFSFTFGAKTIASLPSGTHYLGDPFPDLPRDPFVFYSDGVLPYLDSTGVVSGIVSGEGGIGTFRLKASADTFHDTAFHLAADITNIARRVPDGGLTAAVLGFSLIGLGLLRPLSGHAAGP
jgi:hypothetical protein